MLLNKKGQGDTVLWILVIIVGLIALDKFGIYSLGGGEPTETEQIGDIISQACNDPSNTFTFGPVYTKWGSEITSGENIAWWKNGIYQGTKAVGSTTTLANDDELAFLVGLDSSTRYANYFTSEMPCAPTDLASLSPNGEHELITADVDFTISLFNSDTSLLNSVSANETIGSGEYGQWEVRIDGTSEQGISPQGKIKFIVGAEKNNFTISSVLLGGQSATGSLPSWFTTVNNFNYAVFELDGCPVGTDKICQIRPGNLYIQAKDGVDPNTGAIAVALMNITIANSDYDINTNDNLIMGSGTPIFEDNDGAISGFATDGTHIYIG